MQNYFRGDAGVLHNKPNEIVIKFAWQMSRVAQKMQKLRKKKEMVKYLAS